MRIEPSVNLFFIEKRRATCLLVANSVAIFGKLLLPIVFPKVALPKSVSRRLRHRANLPVRRLMHADRA